MRVDVCARIAEGLDAQLAKADLRWSAKSRREIQSAIIETDHDLSVPSACRVKMLEHFYRIAAELPEKRRTEYLPAGCFFLWCCARERWRSRNAQ